MTAAHTDPPLGPAPYIFIAGQTISYVGSRVTLVALPWAVLTITGSTAQTGAVLLAQTVPYATGGFVLGPLIDRMSRRRLLIAADLARAALIGILALLAGSHIFTLLGYCAVAFFVGCANIASSAAREAVVPVLANQRRHTLVRLNSLIQLGRDGSSAVGPLLGGLLITTAGPAAALTLDAATYLISAGATALSVERGANARPTQPEPTPASGSRYWADFRQGLAYLWRQPVVRLIAVQSALTNMLLTPLFGLVLLQLAHQEWHSAADLGVALTSFGVGSVAGGVFLTVRPALLPNFRHYGLVLLALLLPLWALTTSVPLLVDVGMLLSGIANMALNTAGDTAMQEVTPPELRGRAFATITSALALLEPAGLAIVGGLLVLISAPSAAIVLLAPLTALGLVVAILAPRIPDPSSCPRLSDGFGKIDEVPATIPAN